MGRKIVAALLVVMLALPLGAQQAAPERIRAAVERVGVGGKITVYQLDGREWHGSLSSIDADSFVVQDVDLKTPVTARYDAVRSIEKGYGGKGFLGRRVSPRKSRIAMWSIIGGLILLVAIAASQRD